MSKILCVAFNYRDHAEELGVELPAEPLLFAKLPSARCGPSDPIVLPAESEHVDSEAELAIVIGERVRRISVDDALDAVAGYTVANDVSARDILAREGQWLRGKSFDSFCPLWPDVVPTSILGDAPDLRITQRLNGETMQDSRTSQLIFGVRDLVAYAAASFTLEPGDLILTGTPYGVGISRTPPIPMRAGDVVEIEIEGIGVLRNPVVAEALGLS